MSVKIKHNTYYKEIYDKDEYDILYTDTKWVYGLGVKHKDAPFYKFKKKLKWKSIEEWQGHIEQFKQNCITPFRYKIKEITEADVFLELL